MSDDGSRSSRQSSSPSPLLILPIAHLDVDTELCKIIPSRGIEIVEKNPSLTKWLKEEFIRRFADFKAIEGQFDLLSSPFTCDIETATEELQMELIDLQADNSLRGCLKVNHWSSFIHLCIQKSFNLKFFARKMFVLFASTYNCEQTFSIMKVNKSKNRSLLTDSNLQSVLRISTSNLTPNLNKLVNDCSQIYHSH